MREANEVRGDIPLADQEKLFRKAYYTVLPVLTHMGFACHAQHMSSRALTCSSHKQSPSSCHGATSCISHQKCFCQSPARQTFRQKRSRTFSSISSRRTRSTCTVRASSGGDSPQDSPQTAMSPEEAYQLLGVRESANFDQIMIAKKNLVSKAGNDQDRKTQVCCCTQTCLMALLRPWLGISIACISDAEQA